MALDGLPLCTWQTSKGQRAEWYLFLHQAPEGVHCIVHRVVAGVVDRLLFMGMIDSFNILSVLKENENKMACI